MNSHSIGRTATGGAQTEQNITTVSLARTNGLGNLAVLPDEIIVTDILPRLLSCENDLLHFAETSSVAACFARDTAKLVRDSMTRRRDQEAEASALLRGLQAPRGMYPFSAQQEQRAGQFLTSLAENNVMNRAKNIASRQDWPGAEQAYRDACRRWPDSASAHCGLGDAFYYQERRVEAAHEYARAIELDGSHGLAYFGMGRIHFLAGDFAEAVTNFRCALALNVDLGPLHVVLADSLRQLGLSHEAEFSYLRALAFFPDNPDMLLMVSLMQIVQLKIGPAIANIRLSLSVRPDHAAAFYFWGVALVNQNDFSAAESMLQRALDLDPSMKEVHELLGNIRTEQLRLDEAELSYKRALNLGYDPAHIRRKLERATSLRSSATTTSAPIWHRIRRLWSSA